MNAQMVLSLNSQEAGVYRNSEVECASLCHVARLLADEVSQSLLSPELMFAEQFTTDCRLV